MSALIQYDPAIHGPMDTGPVDPLIERLCDEPCPACGEALTFVPAQSGSCHSGRYATTILQDFYVCEHEDCEAIWIEPQALEQP